MKLIVKTSYSVTTTEHNFFDGASSQVRRVIDAEGIGSSEFHYAKLYDDEDKQFAHVSYNGRVWAGESKDWTKQTEELL